MKTIAILGLVAATVLTADGLKAEESTIPYNAVNKAMIPLKSRKVDGTDCVPFYLKMKGKDQTLDAEEAQFRIRDTDGREEPLRVDLLAEVPVDQRSKFEKKMLEDGYTHILWVPKGAKHYRDGCLASNLPKGSIEMSQGMTLSGSLGRSPAGKAD